LELRGGGPQRQLARDIFIMLGLLAAQTADVWLALRGRGVALHRALLYINLVLIIAVTLLANVASGNFFLLYPLLLMEAAIVFTPPAAYIYTALMMVLYTAASLLGASQGLHGWLAHDLVLTSLEVVLFFVVTGVSIDVVRTWTAEREHIVQLALLDELSLLLADTGRLDDVLERLVELVPSALHVQACAVALDEPGSGRRIWANLGADATALIDDALLARGTAATVRAQPHPGIMRFPVERTSYGAIYTIPLEIDERAVGMLSVARVTSQPFGERDRRLFQSLARHAAQALRNARLYRLEAEAAERSRELEHFKSEMLASVSHEFRLPLSSITLSAETLLAQHAEEAPDAPEVRLLHNIARSAHRLGGFVQDVLDVARLDAHQLELRQRACDIVALARLVIEHMEPQCAMKQQRLYLTTDLPHCWLTGDEKRLEQVLSNLLTNAHQYTPEGGTIALTIAPAEMVHAEGPCGPEPAGMAVAISVRDSGPGIAPEERERIFGRFSRGDAGMRRSAGAGLGLHIARSVVELHGGCLWVEGTPGQGSTFWCLLPLAGKGDDEPALTPAQFDAPTLASETILGGSERP
ncbi:MAG: GAF domain-containing protein, partial [Ktedonobacterales bacterium]|nr:GAF domain-containing protein [Ktedonobacterales bacterium]